MTSATRTSVHVWLAATAIGLVACTVAITVGDLLIWRAGWLGVRLLVFAVLWAFISTTLAFPVIIVVRAVLHGTDRARWQLLAIAVVIAAITSAFAWYLARTVRGSWEGVAVVIGIGTLIGYGIVLARLDLRARDRTIDWRSSGMVTVVYGVLWLSTGVVGCKSARMHEVAFWKETVTGEYWGRQEPTVQVSSLPLGGFRASGNSVVGVSSGFVGFPFVILVDFHVVGLNTGFDGRALYLWLPGYTRRLWGTPLAVWN